MEIYGGAAAYGTTTPGPGALDGTSVTLIHAFEPANAPDLGLPRELTRFEDVTGINTSEQGLVVEAEVSRRLAEGEPPPDVAFYPQPGILASQAGAGRLVDLGAYLDPVTLRAEFGDYLINLATVAPDGSWPAGSGAVYGIPADVDLKGLVFYPQAAFEAAGYVVPSSWEELLDLTRQLVADGRTPWCIAYKSGGVAGWPGTDWVESLVLRSVDPNVHDDWTFHRVPFDDARVRAGALRYEELLSSDDFVRGGVGLISQLDFIVQGIRPLLDDEPGCWLHHQGDFMLSTLPADTQLGSDIGMFVLPPLVSGATTPITGGGNYATAFADRPEVRAFMEFVASPDWGTVWATDAGSNFLSPNVHFDLSRYGLDANESERQVRIELGTAVLDALAADLWRFDASDLMPPAIGAVTSDGILGAFWQGMLDVVDGTRTMSEVLSDIEQAWTALETGDG